MASTEETVQPPSEVKEEPREVVSEQPKEKPERRSVFGSIFKRKNKDEKVVDEPKRSTEEPQHDDGAAAPVVGLGAAGLAAAGGIEEEHAATEEDTRDIDATANQRDDDTAAATSDYNTRLGAEWAANEKPTTLDESQAKPEAEVDDEGIDRVAMAGAVAGTAALGAIIAAGSVAAEQRRSDDLVNEEEHVSDVSSLSTGSDLSDSDDDERELQGVTTAPENSGSYNFAEPSPPLASGAGLGAGLADRPSIMRHISTIESSSGSEVGSPELTEEDEEGYPVGRLAPRPTMVGDFEEGGGVAARDTPIVTSESVPAAVAEEPVSSLDKDEEDPVDDGKIVITGADAQREVVPVAVPLEDTNRDVAPADSVSVAESGPPSPVIKKGPSEDSRKLQKGKEPEEKKESSGVLGFFRKLKNKSKADNKLQKRQASATNSQTSLPKDTAATSKETETAPAVEKENAKDADFVTPITTTTAGAEAEGKAIHMGTDGPIGDPKHVSGLGGEPRPQSPSSFERYKAEPRDLDDVSSSGADEDDVSRGRGGRLARKLGLKRDGGKGKEAGSTVGAEGAAQAEPQSATSRGEEDTFEEARDQFDESLAPPPAFGGQMKSQSPVRETRFQEQL